LLLLGTGASVVGWRVWSRRRMPADEVSFDWSVPPAPEAGIPSTAGEAAESVEPPAATPPTEPEPPPATAAAEGPAEREAESKDEDTTRLEQRGEREAEERRVSAERLGSEPLQGPDGDTDV
jgi:hypothetical protein